MNIIGAYSTLAGPLELGSREWSRFDWAARSAEAAQAGLRGLGIQHADLEHQLRTRSLSEIRQIFDDHGLEFLELEFLTDWFVDDDAAAQQRKDALFEAAAVLGARHIKVGNRYGRPYRVSHLAERYAALAAEAADRHDAVLVYQPMAFSPSATPLDDALEVVATAGTGNTGLALNTWHLTNLGISPDDLRRVPPYRLAYLELTDGVALDPANPIGPLLEAVTRQRFPGEGDYDVAGYVRAAGEIGYDGPWGVQVQATDLAKVPLRELSRRTYTAASMFVPAGSAARAA